MAYFIQSYERVACFKDGWKTWDKRPFETARDALAELTRIGCRVGDRYRIVESYTVTRYKAVKM